jgi:uncharacterized protein DUF4382
MSMQSVSGPRWALAPVLTFILLGCSQGSFSARVDNGNGTVNIFLTDAPLDLAGVTRVNVTLTGVVLFPEDPSGTSTLNMTSGTGETMTPVVIVSHPATFDLLTLTGGATALLGTDEVPAGAYSRIRLEVSDAALVYQDGSTASMRIESGKVDVPVQFKVVQDQTTGIVLDFDAAASVQVNSTASGQFILRPVVTPKSVQ